MHFWLLSSGGLTLKDGDIPSKIPLNGMDIWVRMYDVPIGYVNEAVAKLMGNYIGT